MLNLEQELREIIEAFEVERFERLRRGRASLNDGDIDALRTGLRHCWRSQETGTLLEMAARIPPELLQRDRWLQSFVVAARERSRSTPHG